MLWHMNLSNLSDSTYEFIQNSEHSCIFTFIIYILFYFSINSSLQEILKLQTPIFRPPTTLTIVLRDRASICVFFSAFTHTHKCAHTLTPSTLVNKIGILLMILFYNLPFKKSLKFFLAILYKSVTFLSSCIVFYIMDIS